MLTGERLCSLYQQLLEGGGARGGLRVENLADDAVFARGPVLQSLAEMTFNLCSDGCRRHQTRGPLLELAPRSSEGDQSLSDRLNWVKRDMSTAACRVQITLGESSNCGHLDVTNRRETHVGLG